MRQARRQSSHRQLSTLAGCLQEAMLWTSAFGDRTPCCTASASLPRPSRPGARSRRELQSLLDSPVARRPAGAERMPGVRARLFATPVYGVETPLGFAESPLGSVSACGGLAERQDEHQQRNPDREHAGYSENHPVPSVAMEELRQPSSSSRCYASVEPRAFSTANRGNPAPGGGGVPSVLPSPPGQEDVHLSDSLVGARQSQHGRIYESLRTDPNDDVL